MSLNPSLEKKGAEVPFVGVKYAGSTIDVEEETESTAVPATASTVSNGTGTSASCVVQTGEGFLSDVDHAEGDVFDGSPGHLAKDSGKYHDLARGGKVWDMEQYMHLFRRDAVDACYMQCLPAGKRIYLWSEGVQDSHMYYATIKKFMFSQ